MASWGFIREKLATAGTLTRSGRASAALAMLQTTLANISSEEPMGNCKRAAVLHFLSTIAMEIEDQTLHVSFLSSALRELNAYAQVDSPLESANLLLGLGEELLAKGMMDEGLHFADAALQLLEDYLQEIPEDELAETLRRYALIARDAGLLPTAQYALTLALVLLQTANGIESQLAEDALRLGAPFGHGAVGGVGRYVLQTLKAA